jgi:hypothetical protein
VPDATTETVSPHRRHSGAIDETLATRLRSLIELEPSMVYSKEGATQRGRTIARLANLLMPTGHRCDNDER